MRLIHTPFETVPPNVYKINPFNWSEKREGWFRNVRTHTRDPSEHFSLLRRYRSGCRILGGNL